MANPNQIEPTDPDEARERSPLSGRSAALLYPLFLSLLVAAGLTFLIFGLYETIERAWLSDLEHESLRVLHRLRGIFTALVVGITVGWVVIRASPALLAATPFDEELSPENVREARLRLNADWMIAMRWIAILVIGILAFLAVRVFGLLPAETWWPLIVTAGFLAAVNVIFALWNRRTEKTRLLLVWQAYVDLGVFTVLLHFSGGCENPLSAFMLFHVVVGGILLSRAQCYRLASVGAILFASLAIGEWSGTFAHYPLRWNPDIGTSVSALHFPYVLSAIMIQSAALYLAAYFVTTLSERLRRNEERLILLADRALADRRLLEQALETTRNGMRVLTPDLVPERTNALWKEWFGEGGNTCEIFPELPNVGCPARDCLKLGQLEVVELERPPDGSPRRIFQLSSAPIYDVRGRISRVVQLAHDITSQKEAHARMMRAGQMAAVGELAGQVAHEVNNPIAILSAKASLLLKNQRGDMSEKIAVELEKVIELSDRVARIAQGLLSYSRPSPTVRTLIDLRAPIRKSIAMIEPRTRTREIEVVDRLPDEPVIATANKGEIEQVFLNLFINAVQAMPNGGRLVISLLQRTADPDGREAVETDPTPLVAIAIDDTGNGIAPELRERVFEPFFTTKQDGHGTGLGLSICQGLLRSHGGEIEIEDSPEGGARFIVRLTTGTPKDTSEAVIQV